MQGATTCSMILSMCTLMMEVHQGQITDKTPQQHHTQTQDVRFFRSLNLLGLDPRHINLRVLDDVISLSRDGVSKTSVILDSQLVLAPQQTRQSEIQLHHTIFSEENLPFIEPMQASMIDLVREFEQGDNLLGDVLQDALWQGANKVNYGLHVASIHKLTDHTRTTLWLVPLHVVQLQVLRTTGSELMLPYVEVSPQRLPCLPIRDG